MKKPPAPISVRSGNIEFLKLNAVRWDWRDAYHTLLTLSWPRFTGVLLALYAVLNLGFAALYWLGGASIDGMRPGSFADAFFFSVETFATVGYGHMYPNTLYGHLVATVEIMSGMFGTALITGLIFVRFSRPTARFIFTRTMVVAPFGGQPTLMLRVANQRHQPMIEAEFRVMFFRNETVPEEREEVRRFYTLTLHFDRLIVFPAALTLRHTIDEKSPLHGETLASLQASDARFMASVGCVDTVIPAPVQSQQPYFLA